MGAFSNVFGSDAAEVSQLPDGKNNARNAKIHIATYQTLDTNSTEARNFFFKHYLEKNTFSHIIIDECHRSAWGEWKFILEHNPDAIQIGLTATPRQLILGKQAGTAKPEYADFVSADEKLTRDNFEYFGEPVYEYTLAQGIEDGYLAPPEIFTFDLFHDGKVVPERNQTVKRGDLEGKHLTDSVTGVAAVTTAQVKEEYTQTELDERLLGRDFKTKYKPTDPGGGPGPTPPPAAPPVLVEGVQILIAPTGRWLTAMIDGRHSRITVEEYRERVAERLVASASTLDQFRIVWVQPPERRGLINDIVLAGFPPRALQVAEEAEDCDLYDVLGEVGYGLNRMTKTYPSGSEVVEVVNRI